MIPGFQESGCGSHGELARHSWSGPKAQPHEPIWTPATLYGLRGSFSTVGWWLLLPHHP